MVQADGHGFLLCDKGKGAAAEHVPAPVRNVESEALEHVFGQRLREVADVFLPEDSRAAERKALFHVRQLQHQKPVRPEQYPECPEERFEITDVFHHMTQVNRVERTAIGDDLRRELLGQVTGVDLMTLVPGNRRGNRIGLNANDLCVAGATKGLQKRAVIAANVDRPSGILAGDRRGDQVLEVPRLLEAGCIGIRLAIDQVGGNGIDDLQQAAVLATLEANGKSRIRIIPLLSEKVGDRKVVQIEKEGEVSPLTKATLTCAAHPPLLTK